MRRRVLNFMTAVVASAGLLLSLSVHLSTFFGTDPQEWSLLPLLHVGAIALGIPAIIFAKRRHGEPADSSFAGLFPNAPRWTIVVTALFLTYAVVNGALHFRLAPFSGGPTRLDDGSFAITSRGRFERQITEAEFHRYRAYEARNSSGWWMALYGVWATLLLSALGPDGTPARTRHGRVCDAGVRPGR